MKRVIAAVAAIFLFVFAPIVSATDFGYLSKKVLASLVQLKTNDDRGYCSGFVIDAKRDFVLTAEHCVASDRAAMGGIVIDGKPARVLPSARFPAEDVAVLQIHASARPALRPEFKPLRTGQEVVAAGFGWGIPDYNFRPSHVSNPVKRLPGWPGIWVELSLPHIGGMSGGPVVNQDGKVVGMVQIGNSYAGYGHRTVDIWRVTRDYWQK